MTVLAVQLITVSIMHKKLTKHQPLPISSIKRGTGRICRQRSGEKSTALRVMKLIGGLDHICIPRPGSFWLRLCNVLMEYDDVQQFGHQSDQMQQPLCM